MPPLPKPAHLRQRRNKEVTRATLPSVEKSARNRVPELPKKPGGWHAMTKDWWSSVWRSPMASEYLGPDVRGGLYMLAYLHEGYWQTLALAGYDAAVVAGRLKELASEIRLQEVRFGLSPLDRRRLQWEVEKGEEAAEKTRTRRQAKRAPQRPVKDPRSVLKAV
jgi:hypothetical protein